MDYGDLLRRSWALVRRHPYLWLLALFAGESAGGASFNGNFGNFGTRGGGVSSGGPVQRPNLQPVLDWIAAHAALLAAGALLLVVLWVVLFIVSCRCASAVVRAVDRLDEGEEVGLGAAWRLGRNGFGGVLRLRLLLLVYAVLVVVPLALLVLAAVLAGFEGQWLALGLAVYLGAGVLAVLAVIGIVLPTLLRLALRAIVLDGLGAVAGLRAAVALARRRIGPVLVLFAIELATGIAVGIVILVAGALLVGPVVVVGLTAHNLVAVAAVVAVVVLIVVIAAIFLAAGVAAFLSTVWTLGYRRLRAA